MRALRNSISSTTGKTRVQNSSCPSRLLDLSLHVNPLGCKPVLLYVTTAFCESDLMKSKQDYVPNEWEIENEVADSSSSTSRKVVGVFWKSKTWHVNRKYFLYLPGFLHPVVQRCLIYCFVGLSQMINIHKKCTAMQMCLQILFMFY